MRTIYEFSFFASVFLKQEETDWEYGYPFSIQIGKNLGSSLNCDQNSIVIGAFFIYFLRITDVFGPKFFFSLPFAVRTYWTTPLIKSADFLFFKLFWFINVGRCWVQQSL
jgi:hypothetical protein